jgi:holo-[acyl-carrier protein] synthase
MADAVFGTTANVGIDVVDVADFERLSFEEHSLFYARCFTAREIAYCRAQARPAQHFAARFAAKEAGVKALGQYMPLAYWQVEVARHTDGKPTLALWTFDRAAPLSELAGLQLCVSLSHADAWAAALVVAFTRDTSDAA